MKVTPADEAAFHTLVTNRVLKLRDGAWAPVLSRAPFAPPVLSYEAGMRLYRLGLVQLGQHRSLTLLRCFQHTDQTGARTGVVTHRSRRRNVVRLRELRRKLFWRTA